MWLSFLDSTYDRAVWWNDAANFALICSLVVGVIATFIIVKTSSTKEEHLNRALADSRERTACLERQSAEANEKAEKERLARIRLEEDLAWRRLPKEKQQILSSRLSKFSGQAVALWFGAGDKEAETFAWEFASGLNSAKWQVFSPASHVTMAASGHPFNTISPLATGITVSSTGDKSSMEAAQQLVHELLDLGFDATKSSKLDERTTSLVVVTIEVRPEGPQGEAKIRAKSR